MKPSRGRAKKPPKFAIEEGNYCEINEEGTDVKFSISEKPLPQQRYKLGRGRQH